MNVQEIVDALNSYSKESNSRRSTNGLLPISYFAINNLDNLRSKPEIIKKLKINNIESLYNIQNIKINNEFGIHTSIISDLPQLLSTDALLETVNIGAEKVKFYHPELAQAPLPFLIEKNRLIQADLQRAIRHNYVVDDHIEAVNQSLDLENINLTQNSVVVDVNETPEKCNECIQKKNAKHGNNCNKHCFYAIADLTTLAMGRVQAELLVHNHPQTLKNKKTKKYYGVEELRDILIAHYRSFHSK